MLVHPSMRSSCYTHERSCIQQFAAYSIQVKHLYLLTCKIHCFSVLGPFLLSFARIIKKSFTFERFLEGCFASISRLAASLAFSAPKPTFVSFASDLAIANEDVKMKVCNKWLPKSSWPEMKYKHLCKPSADAMKSENRQIKKENISLRSKQSAWPVGYSAQTARKYVRNQSNKHKRLIFLIKREKLKP